MDYGNVFLDFFRQFIVVVAYNIPERLINGGFSIDRVAIFLWHNSWVTYHRDMLINGGLIIVWLTDVYLEVPF